MNHVALMIGYKYGLYIDEVYSLMWEDIDFENKLLHVNCQVRWEKDESRTIMKSGLPKEVPAAAMAIGISANRNIKATVLLR